MIGEIVGDHIHVTGLVGLLNQLQKPLVVHTVARRQGVGDGLPVADAGLPVDPDLLLALGVFQRRRDSVPVDGRAW